MIIIKNNDIYLIDPEIENETIISFNEKELDTESKENLDKYIELIEKGVDWDENDYELYDLQILIQDVFNINTDSDYQEFDDESEFSDEREKQIDGMQKLLDEHTKKANIFMNIKKQL